MALPNWTDITTDLLRDIQQEDKTCYSNFTLLAEMMRKIEVAEGGTSEIPSAEEIRQFWETEQEVKPGGSTPKRKRKSKKQIATGEQVS